MPLVSEQGDEIKDLIKHVLREKFEGYSPETKRMPFHYRLLGKDRMALFSFIHSLNTTFGKSVFEPVAEILAGMNFVSAQKQYEVGNAISTEAQSEIQAIINELTMGKAADKAEEIERIREVCNRGTMNSL